MKRNRTVVVTRKELSYSKILEMFFLVNDDVEVITFAIKYFQYHLKFLLMILHLYHFEFIGSYLKIPITAENIYIFMARHTGNNISI